jgi:hypothetical protein
LCFSQKSVVSAAGGVSKKWRQRLFMVGNSFCGMAVIKINIVCAGGSSKILSRALAALVLSVSADCMITTLCAKLFFEV